MRQKLKLFCIYTLSIFATINVSAHASPSVAIVDFDTSHHRQHYLGSEIAKRVNHTIDNSKRFSVVARQTLKDIAKDMATQSINTPQYIAEEIGQRSGAELLVSGEIVSARAQKKSFYDNGVRVVEANYQLQVKAYVMDIATGDIVYSTIENANKSYNNTGDSRHYETDAFVELAHEVADKLGQNMLKRGESLSTNEQALTQVLYH